MQEESRHWPAVKDTGTLTRGFRFGQYSAAVFTDVVAAGTTEYLYLMPVLRVVDQKLCMVVSSEKNRMYGKSFSGDGTPDMGESHFLCVYPGDEHWNLGSSNDWADLDRFTAKALEVAREHLGVEDPAVEQRLGKPWWRFW
jgi:hypothetical protein